MLVALIVLTLACTPDDPSVDSGDVADSPPPGDSDVAPDSDPPGDSEPPDDSDPPAEPTVRVNELMSANESALVAEDGSFPDWIELFNTGDRAVDLSGFSMSDDWTDKQQALLPEGTSIEPGGHLLLWADDRDEPGHLPFKLSADGEGVGLFTPDGQAVDWTTFPPLADDHAWARLPDGGETWADVPRGTPGSANAMIEARVTSLVERGASWRYLDSGVYPGDDWTEPGFDDAGWAEGPAPLGYGDGQTTQVSYGDDSSDKHITTWFRRSVEVPAELLEGISEVSLELRIDDGGLVWLDGVELLRQGMPEGEITPETYASHTASGDDETSYTVYQLDTELIQAGERQLAVEVHQRSASSSDISFDLSLSVVSWERVE
jgi:hypothetical protein